MVLTDKVWLPTEEELTVQELNLTYPVLQAASFHMGKYCEWFSNEFTLCRDELKDPRHCIKEGKNLTACGVEFFRKVKSSCSDEFTQYYNCIDKSSGAGDFTPCRKTQAVFDNCMKDKLNLERPGYGYFCQVKIHESPRPEPQKKPITFEGTPDPLPAKPYEAPPRYANNDYLFK